MEAISCQDVRSFLNGNKTISEENVGVHIETCRGCQPYLRNQIMHAVVLLSVEDGQHNCLLLEKFMEQIFDQIWSETADPLDPKLEDALIDCIEKCPRCHETFIRILAQDPHIGTLLAINLENRN